jgi:diaminohydroxyphosphoribosylaminopyrimidine deaminase/5-amino-6-(5-phosphoribosylamino)uracil reductase
MSNPTSYMRRALTLAQRAHNQATPNPTVGAVVVRDGSIIGEGVTSPVGGPHAEINAFIVADTATQGAELYVTLEPCSFHGRTPPCCEAVAEAGIKKVYCAMQDPDPRVNGTGFEHLRQHGIEVEVGLLQSEAEKLHAAYITHRTKKRPLIILKLAQTLDGRIAARSGDARWITGEEARRHVHRNRSRVDAVAVGANTLISDDPQLNVRHTKGRDPRPIAIDGRLRAPLEAQLFARPGAILATGQNAPTDKLRAIEEKGTEVWTFAEEGGRIALRAFAERAAAENITSLIVEGGGEVAAAFLREKIVDQVHIYIAPRILGEGIAAIADLQIERIKDSLQLKDVHTRRLGADLLYTAEVEYPCLQE